MKNNQRMMEKVYNLNRYAFLCDKYKKEIMIRRLFYQNIILLLCYCNTKNALNIQNLLKTTNLIKKLKFFSRLPHTETASIVNSHQVCYTLLGIKTCKDKVIECIQTIKL